MTTTMESVRTFRQAVAPPTVASRAAAGAALRAAINAEQPSRSQTPTASHARYSRPSRRPRRSRRLTIALALAAALAASAGIALAADVLLPDLSTPAPQGPATAPPRGLLASFSIFRQPLRATDSLPAAGVAELTSTGGFGPHYGVNTSLSRLAGVINHTRVWLVPGRTGSCIYGPAGGAACAPNSKVAAEGLLLALVPSNGSPAEIIGVLPDRATVTATLANRSPAPVRRSGNTYSIGGAQGLATFTVRTANGRTVVTPAPTGAPPPPK